MQREASDVNRRMHANPAKDDKGLGHGFVKESDSIIANRSFISSISMLWNRTYRSNPFDPTSIFGQSQGRAERCQMP